VKIRFHVERELTLRLSRDPREAEPRQIDQYEASLPIPKEMQALRSARGLAHPGEIALAAEDVEQRRFAAMAISGGASVERPPGGGTEPK
jgi:hypothetical protein